MDKEEKEIITYLNRLWKKIIVLGGVLFEMVLSFLKNNSLPQIALKIFLFILGIIFLIISLKIFLLMLGIAFLILLINGLINTGDRKK